MPNLYVHPMHNRQPAARKAYRAHFTAGALLLVILVATLAGMAYAATPADAAPLEASHALTMAPACTAEDGSGQRVCVWDGAHAGNGIGRSLVIRHGGTDRGTYTYVSHRRAHRLIQEWELAH